MDELENVRFYETLAQAEKDRIEYDRRKKVKTDVFRVKHCERGFYIEQDIA